MEFLGMMVWESCCEIPDILRWASVRPRAKFRDDIYRVHLSVYIFYQKQTYQYLFNQPKAVCVFCHPGNFLSTSKKKLSGISQRFYITENHLFPINLPLLHHKTHLQHDLNILQRIPVRSNNISQFSRLNRSNLIFHPKHLRSRHRR